MSAGTIGVGCGLVLRRGRSILLLRRRKPPEADHWSLVGGKVDFLEAVEAAARRECLEEVGIEAGTLTLLGLSEQPMPGEDQHWISPICLADRFSGEPALLEPTKHAELGWFDLDELPVPLALGARHGAAMLRAHLNTRRTA